MIATQGTLELPNKQSRVDSLERVKPKTAGRGFFVTKRCVDLFGACGLLTVLSPVMLLVALGIRATSRGPVILRQTRLTIGGREFTLLKFRTMRQDAEKSTGPKLAEAGDPRVTRLGRILRKTRLDELPQLINVVRGEMSLIGPRPERPEIAEQLGEIIHGFDRRRSGRAGIPG
jgi:lipopolysaccharide/colanic/teichoic acid biosynthesis glycosyltransferase